MEKVSLFVSSVTAMSVFCMLCEYLLPSGNMRRSAKTAFSVLLVSFLTATVINLLGGVFP